MSRLSMVGNGVRLLVLLDRSRGADVKYPLLRLFYALCRSVATLFILWLAEFGCVPG